MLKFFASLILALAVILPVSASPDAAKPPVVNPLYGGNPDIVEFLDLGGIIGPMEPGFMADKVRAVNENPKIRVVILTVNTPGGGATASSGVYEELSKLKVPVVGWCDQVCASGGMYALMSPVVKKIYVRNETISGSIGVIAQITRFHRLMDFLKIDNETYRSGELKDAGNPARAAQPAEVAYLQGIVDNLAKRFYATVEKGRGSKITDWNAIKSARIFIGDEAVKVGLADGVKSKEEVIQLAKELSGSKLIFTRDELKKMSKVADSGSGASYSAPNPSTWETDLHYLVETLKDMRSGTDVRFSYLMPYKF